MKIFARKWWNDTDVTLIAGKRYRLTASGRWTDWTVSSGPEGYELPKLDKFRRWRRVPEAAWFALIGAIDKKSVFVIGTGVNLEPVVSGRLFCYANDVRVMYWNNKGFVELKVEEI
ncbi:MAG TPA: hypothetical protein VGK04_04560 [Thermoanaerobaculia bacterium]|jgi:hypothetical protein